MFCLLPASPPVLRRSVETTAFKDQRSAANGIFIGLPLRLGPLALAARLADLFCNLLTVTRQSMRLLLLAGANMNLQHIRYVLALCEERSFTRAAARCGVSQPSLTNAIKQLESEFGALLFLRGKRGAQPTTLALTMKPHLTHIRTKLERLERIAMKNRKKGLGTQFYREARY